MATIKEVANLAGVSLTTVSRVLNRDNRLSVTPEVRRKIYEAAYQLNYVTPRQRRKASEKSKLLIGVADWKFIRSDRPNISLETLNCMMQVMNAEMEIKFVRLSPDQPVEIDGIIAFGEYTDEEVVFLRSLSHFIIFVESERQDYEYDHIQVDAKYLLDRVLDYLYDEKGYKSVGYIGGVFQYEDYTIGKRRMELFKDALLAKDAENSRYFHVGEISRESGYEMFMKAYKEGTLARAVVLGGDEITEGAMDAIAELNLRVPEDIALILYRGMRTMDSIYPTATCIEMYPEPVWEYAMGLLVSHMQKQRSQVVKLTIPPYLRKGDTA